MYSDFIFEYFGEGSVLKQFYRDLREFVLDVSNGTVLTIIALSTCFRLSKREKNKFKVTKHK